MSSHFHRTNAAYAAALIIVLAVAFSLDAGKATGLAAYGARDISVKIAGLRIPAAGAATEGAAGFQANIFSSGAGADIMFRFDLEYPGGTRLSKAEIIPGSIFAGGAASVSLPFALSERGIYKLTVTADPNNAMGDINRENNADAMLFRI